jgi:NAD-dependent SIR2 family protein deacetylase
MFSLTFRWFPTAAFLHQNVDGLELSAGVSRSKLVACHGSLATVTCTGCKQQSRADDDGTSAFGAAVRSGQVPRCARCAAVLKPDVTFFGEPLRASVKRALESDRNKADFLLVIGTSLQVCGWLQHRGAYPTVLARS